MPVELVKQPPLATVTFNAPERHNALAPQDRFEATDLLRGLEHDGSVRAVVLTGAGRSFCAGADVGGMGGDGIFGARTRMQRGAHGMIKALRALEKPTIASVRGYVLGMGWSLALAADWVIASENARFCTMFSRRGLAPDSGAVHLLARNVGELRAKELVYSARMVDADEALRLGLVTEVVPDDQLEDATAALADRLANGPTKAFGFTKRLFEVAADSSLERFLEVEAMVQPQINQSEDFREGVTAFREKREPRFLGR